MKKKKKSGVDTAFLSLIPHGFGFSPGWVEISGIMVGQRKQQWVFCFFSKHPLLQSYVALSRQHTLMMLKKIYKRCHK